MHGTLRLTIDFPEQVIDDHIESGPPIVPDPIDRVRSYQFYIPSLHTEEAPGNGEMDRAQFNTHNGIRLNKAAQLLNNGAATHTQHENAPAAA